MPDGESTKERDGRLVGRESIELEGRSLTVRPVRIRSIPTTVLVALDYELLQ